MFTYRFGINVGISLYSMALLVFIYISVRRQTAEYTAHPHRQKSFLAIIVLTFALIVSDMFSRMDGFPGTLFTLAQVGNFILFLLNPLLVLVWYLYLCDQIGLDSVHQKRGMLLQSVLYSINTAAVIATPFTGWLYYFDSACVYHRGPLFWLTSAVTVLMILHCELLVTRRRARLERRYFYALFFFPTIPVISNILQVAFYGIAFALNATAYSLIIVFVFVQNRSMDVDYLTGLYNRRKLDMSLQQAVRASTEGHSFSAILLDIDHFKQINDSFGHSIGDTALEDAADMLKRALGPRALVARYGGDEFCAILDTDDECELQAAIESIERCEDEFNSRGSRPYRLRFSMGGAVYDPATEMKPEEFIGRIDALMYDDKRATETLCVD